MLTFNGSQELKNMYVMRVRQAIEMNNFVVGTWGGSSETGWRGCALGVMSHEGNSGIVINQLSEETGIPRNILSLIPDTFDFLPDGERDQFALNFIQSVPVGVELGNRIGENISLMKGMFYKQLYENKPSKISDVYTEVSCRVSELIINTLRAIPDAVVEPVEVPVEAKELIFA